MTWIVTADSNLCRIYKLEKPASLQLVKIINHPELRAKKSEYLTNDKPGRYKSDAATGGGAFMPHSDPKEVEVDHFAREIAQELNQGRNQLAYKELITICLPHMKGLLYKHMDKNVKEMVKIDIEKDVMHLAPPELSKFISSHLKPQ